MTHAPPTPAPDETAAPRLTRADLLCYLEQRGYRTTTVDHDAVATVAESSTVDLGLPGAHTKNLFLKDENGRLLLLVAKSSTKVDLKRVAKTLGMGRLSFGKPELMLDALGVTPGSVTAFAILNDKTGRVRIVLDNALTEHESVNCHPLENVATTNIALNDLLSFIRGTGHEPTIMIVSAQSSHE